MNRAVRTSLPRSPATLLPQITFSPSSSKTPAEYFTIPESVHASFDARPALVVHYIDAEPRVLVAATYSPEKS